VGHDRSAGAAGLGESRPASAVSSIHGVKPIEDAMNGRLWQLVVYVVVVTWIASSCGGSSSDPAAEEAEPRFSVDELAQRFREITGHELEPEGDVLDLTRFGGGTSLSLSQPSFWERQGEFRFVVQITAPREPMLEMGLLDAEGVKPDRDGIYWVERFPEDQREDPYWTAHKFRDNVKLVWFAPARRATPFWHQLAEVLTALRRT
jgi:hypothetical protein